MNNRKKSKGNRTKRKSKKRGRRNGRMANFMGALLLEICGMVLLLTLFFAFRESPAALDARLSGPEKPTFDFVPPDVQTSKFESYVAGLFE